MILRRAQKEDFDWFLTQAVCGLSQFAEGIACVDGGGRTRGVVIYDNWRPNSVEMHVALTPSAYRPLLGVAFVYPFQTRGVGMVYGVIPAFHRKSLRLALRLGFSETYRVRDGWSPGVDLVQVEMRRVGCRWLEKETRAA